MLVLRPAEFQDWHELMLWRNDPETRKNSMNNEVVSLSDHMKWLQRTLNDPSRELFVAERDGAMVGTVRADHRIDEIELSWTVSPQHRGKGVATEMVRQAVQRYAAVYATIKSDNKRSIRVAEKAGLVLSDERDGVLTFRKVPDVGAAGAENVSKAEP